MTRTPTLLLAVVLVIGSVSAFPVAAAAQAQSSVNPVVDQSGLAQVDDNASENATNVSPGERLSGVIGAGQAEFEGEIELRAYGIEYALAASNGSKADVVKDRLETIQERLQELERQRDQLREANRNGSIDDGEYRARATELAARTETVEQMANASEARAGSLPADVLERKGINVSAIQMLRMNAENLTGPEVAAIARSIAGPDVGMAISRGPPADIGGAPDGIPDAGDRRDGDGDAGDRGAAEAEAAVERAAVALDAAEARLDQAETRIGDDPNENATEALQNAREALDRARQALEDARAAAESGDVDEAMALAEDALSHAEQAEAHAQEALDAAEQSGPDTDGTDGTTGTASGTDGGA